MGRHVREVTLNDRGEAKVFLLTEMPASQAEKWAIKVFLALAKSGVEIPDDIAERGFAGVAYIGLKALGGIDFEYAEPLLDEMFACIQFKAPAGVRALVESDIEDVQTRLRLRAEVFELHTGFSIPGVRSNPAPAVDEEPQPQVRTQSRSGTRISLRPSGR